MPSRILIVGLACLACSVQAEAAWSQAGAFPLRVDRVEAVGLEAEMGSLLDAALAPDGTIYAVDHLNARVVAFEPGGRERWRVGGRGRAPGEFDLPYRVAVGPNGTVYVLDFASREISRFSSAGRFVDRSRLPFSFAQVDGLQVGRRGEVFVSGHAPEAPAGARSHAVHRFSWEEATLRHDTSFGALPRVRDPAVLRMWGAGFIRAGNEGVWYARRSPWEVTQYDSRGRRIAALRPSFRSTGRPDDAVAITREGGGESFTSRNADVVYPATLVELAGGALLVGRIAGEGRWWDVFDASGRHLASRRVPAEWGGLVGYDAARGLLWVTGSFQDTPVLLRMPLELPLSLVRRRNP